MSAQFQNRLVGTVVIVALGVIFLPDLLDGKKQREIEEFTEIPLRPVINEQTSDVIGEGYTPETFEVEEIAQTQDLGSSEQASNKETAKKEADSVKNNSGNKSGNNATKAKETQAKETQAKETSPKQVAKTTPAVKKVEPIKAGYTLQLGGFNNAKNVEELVKKLRQNGFTAYTLPVKPIDGSLTKVFVGPELSADKLKTYQAKIKKLNGLQGKIVQYNPLEN